MPIGGERIGSAYVRIFGDGSGLPNDIREALNEAEPAVRAAGRRQGDAYAEEFQGGLTRDQQRDFGQTLRENLERGMAEADLTNAYFEGEDWKRFRGRLREEFGEAGEVAGRQLQERFQAAGSGRGLSDAVRDIIPEIRRATAEIQAEELRIERERDTRRDEQFRAEVERLADLANLQDRAYAEDRRRTERQDAFYEDYEDRQFDREVARLADLADLQDQAVAEDARRAAAALQRQREDRDRDFDREVDRYRREGELIRARQQAYEEQARRSREYTRQQVTEANEIAAAVRRLGTAEQRTGQGRRGLARDIRDIRAALESVPAGRDRDNLVAQIDAIQRGLRRAHPEVERFNRGIDRIGDGVGRVFGRGSRNNFVNAIGGAARGLTSLALLGPKVAFSIGRQMVDAFQSASSVGGGLVKAIGSLGGSLIKGGAQVAILAGAITALVFIAGPVAALISGITAALIGLGSTLVLGAIAALVGAIGVGSALVVGAGVAALAIAGMSDEMKDRLRPEIEATKEAFKSLGEDAGDAIGPGLEKALSRIPSILERISPLTTKVAETLGDLAAQYAKGFDSPGFSNFINEVTPFLSNQIQGLGDAVQNFGEGFGGFFLAARPLIRETVGGIEDLAERFNDFANSKAGREDIREFLRDAGTSAGALADFVGQAAKTLGTLATAGNESGNTIIDDLTGKLEELQDYLQDPANKGAIGDFFSNGVEVARDLGNGIKFIADLIGDLDTEQSRQQLQDFFDTLGDIGGAIRDAAPFFVKLGESIEFTVDAVKASVDAYQLLGEALQFIAGFGFDGLGDKLKDLALSLGEVFNIGPEPMYKIGESADFLRDKMEAAEEATRDFKSEMDTLKNSLNDVTGATTDATRSIVDLKFAESGAADGLDRFNITQRDVVDAALGRQYAIDKVRAATEGATGADKEAANAIRAFVGLTNLNIEAQQAQARETARNAQEFGRLRDSLKGNLFENLQSNGIEPTNRGLAETILKYDQLNNTKNIRKLIDIVGLDISVADMKALIARLKEADETDANPKIDANTKPFDGKFKATKRDLLGLDALVADPRMDANDKPYRGKSAATKRDLLDIDRITASPIFDANSADYFAVARSVRADLAELNGNRAVVYIETQRSFTGGDQGGTEAAGGGTVPKSGRGYADRYPYMLADGEEVISNRFGQADRYRALLKAINAGTPIGNAASGVTVGSGKTIDASGWQIVTPTADPRAVADEVFAKLNAATF